MTSRTIRVVFLNLVSAESGESANYLLGSLIDSIVNIMIFNVSDDYASLERLRNTVYWSADIESIKFGLGELDMPM